jgi:hypothetical protein
MKEVRKTIRVVDILKKIARRNIRETMLRLIPGAVKVMFFST